ncbi:TonB-dependent receptor domain-containing protein [Pseudocnuella soli]|uniref:TonB-dependent receptor domain-containing protein n=1 Tax=Pseudocnuella soli TaxID=2502779 RepID=UPI0010522DFF|nr:TonB-dependent receptor [Pseudocnuella soli]
MKKIRSIILMLLCIAFTHTYAQTATQDSSATFKVSGACGMCKQRIEKSLKIKGVSKAKWDVPTNMLSVTYNPAEISLDGIHKHIAGIGHDTEKEKATQKVYESLPDCCRYRDLQGTHGEDEGAEHHDEEAPAVVRGVVLEEDSKGNFKPLEGATAMWLGTTKGVASNAEGVFTLPYEPGQEKLVISYAGRKPDTLQVDDHGQVKVVMASGKELKEVRVTSGRASTYINGYNPFRTAVMTQKELFKAACCNLSESFETNPSVDVSYSDAVTGSKQIQLLGLSGVYTQLTVENLPGPRGLATSLGLNSIAGPWVESIELTKGIGSVVNGYESIAGQINVELKKPANTDRLHVNGYVNTMGKSDLNLNYAQKLGSKWSTMLLLHDDFLYNKVDQNKDGFVDLPTGNLFSGVNRWQYQGTNLMGQFGVKVLTDNRIGGSINYDESKHKGGTNEYGLGIDTRRYEAFGKLGYIFPEKKYQSIGLQLSAFNHKQDSYFGLTQYNGRQQNFYANLIYQSIIGNTAHKFKTGLSFLYDKYNEQLNTANYQRSEAVPGGFFEYTFEPVDKFTVVAGMRADHNSLFGAFVTPRLNVRYQPVNNTTIRASFGRGQRTANIFAENNGALVSARQVQILNPAAGGAYGLDPEVSWNKGISVDQKFILFGRNANVGIDFYRNDFQNQVVVDYENPRLLKFYNLEGKSFSNSFQAEVSVMPVARLELRLAYRYFDVKTEYSNQLLQKPLTSKHRAFANAAYEVSGWKFDYTFNLIGPKRLPSTEGNPHHYMLMNESPSYVLMNAQISKTLGKSKAVDLYLGGENLTNFMQHGAVLASDQPFGPYFDASMIWGPVNGRQIYAGFRYTIK